MRLRLLVVGRDRRDPLVEASDAYLDRVRRTLPVDVVEVKEVPLKKSSSPERVRSEESERLLAAVGTGERLVALDATGRALDSEGVAQALDRAMQSGTAGLCFALGGPLGHHADLVRRADEVWSLSKLTLPHRLARLVLCEQLYRGLSILRGEPYHK